MMKRALRGEGGILPSRNAMTFILEFFNNAANGKHLNFVLGQILRNNISAES